MQVVRAIVRNRETKLLQPFPNEALREAFSFHVPNYFFMPKYKDGLWDGRVHKLSRGKLPTGLLLALKDTVERDLDIRFDLQFDTKPIRFRPISNTDARDYQLEGLKAMQVASKTGGGLIIQATGSGKTMLAGLYFFSLVGKGCFIVNELTLLHQSRDAIAAVLNEPVGIVGQSKFAPERITVATVQTLYRHQTDPRFMDWVQEQDVLVIDELHIQLSRSVFSVIENICAPVVFGLTATLQLTQTHINMKAYSVAGPVIFTFPLEQATQRGYLTRGIVVQIAISTNIWELGDYTKAYHKLIANQRRNELLVSIALAAIRQGRRVVILVEWVGHIKNLVCLVNSKVESRAIYGAVPVADRRAAIEEFEKGEVPLLIANRVFQVGVDIRTMDFIIDATGGKSPTTAIQRYGRGVRQAENKRSLVYVDIADNGQFGPATKRRKSAFKKENIRVYNVCHQPTLNIDRFVQKAIALSVGE